jgi:hypothetical protein
MNAPNKYQLSLLREAIKKLDAEGLQTYLTLKRLLREQPDGFKDQFRRMFENYYGLNTGGVTGPFKNRYFELLFGLKLEEGVDPYTPILKELYEIPRRKGDKALECSFVSKLVAIHDETRPLFDQHVSAFFGITVPSSGCVDFRIAGFVDNMEWLRQTYCCWSADSQFQRILSTVKQKRPSLEGCADPRLADFLVWTVGRKKLKSSPEGERKP